MAFSKYVKSHRGLFLVLQPLRWLVHVIKYNSFTDKRYIVSTFEKTLGYKLDLTNPQTFSEKIQWMKLNLRDEKRTTLADKLRCRAYVAKLVGEDILIPLHLSTEDVSDIKAENLPDSAVVIKTNHASGKVFIIKDKSTEDFDKIREYLTNLLYYNFYHAHREYHYKHIKPAIMVEQFIAGKDGDVPEDYKFHCFAGEIKFIQIDTGRFTSHKRVFYDVNWQRQAFDLRFPAAEDIVQPPMLAEMLKIAKVLSAEFNYVRVDLYATDSQVFFGELTFTPGAGFEKFHPQEIDRQWGSHLSICPTQN